MYCSIVIFSFDNEMSAVITSRTQSIDFMEEKVLT